MRSIRVLHLQVHLADGGGPRLVLELARRLPDHGVHLAASYLTPPHDMASPYRDVGVETTFLDHRTGRGPRTVVDMVRRIRDTGADIVHTHEMLSKMIGHPAARIAKVPVVTHIHGFYPRRSFGAYRDLKRRAQFRLAYGRRVDRAIAVSHAVGAQHASMVPCPVVVLHNGVDIERFGKPGDEADRLELARRLGVEDRKVILFVGRLVPLKRVTTLLPMLEQVRHKLPESVLVVCGDGPERERLADAVERTGLSEHVRFVGWVGDVVPMLQLADVFVFPSRVEGLGLAPLEAMAAGTPVVASRLPVIGEYVRDGLTGLMVDPEDPDEFAGAVAGILTDPEEAGLMVDRARELVAADFNLDIQAGRLADMYREVLAARHR